MSRLDNSDIDDLSDVDEDDDIIDPTYQPPSNDARTVIMSDDDDDETNDVAGPSNAPSQPLRRKPQFTWKEPSAGRRGFNPGYTSWSENYDIGDPLE